MMALEVEMDEMAEKLGLDLVAFRILNDTQVDPESPSKPFSQRQLVKCMELGAARFGWNRRNVRPGTRREGRWVVGIGTAAAIRGAPVIKLHTPRERASPMRAWSCRPTRNGRRSSG